MLLSLYTAVTRGKKFVVVVGMPKAIAIAIKNTEALKRYTGLKNCLHLEFDKAKIS